jgi:hypothetical protein
MIPTVRARTSTLSDTAALSIAKATMAIMSIGTPTSVTKS